MLQAQQNRTKILVVEDDLVTWKLEQMILEQAGYEVYLAENGLAALQLLEKERADLILTDLLMPEMSGIEFLKHLKSDPCMSRIPVAVCSSVAELENVKEVLSSGVCEYVLKPINAKDLLKRIEKARNKVIPILKDPLGTSFRLGLNMDRYKELLQWMSEHAIKRLREIGARVEVSEIDEFELFARDLSSSAKSLGAFALSNAILETNKVLPKADKNLRKEYFFKLRTEVEHLRKAVFRLPCNNNSASPPLDYTCIKKFMP